ncbi:hypothetical protein E4U42_002634 [Claviceps africana]|uniref:Uncharacterized protein n=1 Tax=Claviceps africana TaxID=83212 RepID=A0A8K0JD83_9HYPO|nr:hypothetical protein E4U42_002634 [Claviceps africana]
MNHSLPADRAAAKWGKPLEPDDATLSQQPNRTKPGPKLLPKPSSSLPTCWIDDMLLVIRNPRASQKVKRRCWAAQPVTKSRIVEYAFMSCC